jgi:hypothetical protein
MSKFGERINSSRFGNINHAYNKMNSAALKPEIKTTITEPIKNEVEEKKEEIVEKPEEEVKPETKLKRYNSLKLAVEQMILNKKKKDNGWTIIS